MASAPPGSAAYACAGGLPIIKTRQDEKSLAEFARRYDAPRSAIAICGSTEAVVVCNSPCLQLRCGWSGGMQAGWSLRMVSDLCRAAPQR